MFPCKQKFKKKSPFLGDTFVHVRLTFTLKDAMGEGRVFEISAEDAQITPVSLTHLQNHLSSVDTTCIAVCGLLVWLTCFS